MTPADREQLLASIPPEVLFTRGAFGRTRPDRAGALARWCEARGFRPTLAQIEGERERRRTADRDRREVAQ